MAYLFDANAGDTIYLSGDPAEPKGFSASGHRRPDGKWEWITSWWDGPTVFGAGD